MAKSDRLLAVLWLLRSRGTLTASQIAGELAVTERTVYRYIDALCASGAPIASEGGPGGGYLLLDTFREPPVFFDSEERAALLHASMFADRTGYPLSAALHRALEKIRYRMSAEQLEELGRHGEALGVVSDFAAEGGVAAPAQSATVGTIEAASALSRCLVIDYGAIGGGPRRRRTIEPYGIVYWQERWYVVAYCRLRRGMRLFRADRIAEVEVLGEEFARPEGFSVTDWFTGAIMPDPPSDEPPYLVHLEGDAAAIDHLARNWFLRRFVAARTDTSLVLRLVRSGALEHLPAILLGYAVSLRVVDPPELAERVATLAGKIARSYTIPRD